MDIGVEQVNEPLTAEELIVLVDIMHLVLEEKIRRLEDYIEYRERRHTFDREDIDKLKTYLAECKKK